MITQAETIVEGILAYLKARRAENLLPMIIEKLQAHVHHSSETAKIISAVALTLEEQASMREFLKKNFGKDFTGEFLIDPSIIGGFIIRVGDSVIDESIKSKLKKLSEEMED